MNNRNTTHTSFWSGDYFNSFETANDTRKLYQLAQGKRAIANFVNISTGKRIPLPLTPVVIPILIPIPLLSVLILNLQKILT